MAADKTDIELRHDVSVSLHEFDALAIETHVDFVESLPTLPSVAVCAVGLMGEQTEDEQDIPAAVTVMRSNFEGPASIFSILANQFIERGSGSLVGISSVAGERGRATNYIYGSSKAGFIAFLSGLRNRAHKHGFQVITVLPGFVATQMTEGLNLPGALTAQPSEVANAVVKAVSKKRNVIYVRPIWRLIMAIIRILPECLFKRLGL